MTVGLINLSTRLNTKERIFSSLNLEFTISGWVRRSTDARFMILHIWFKKNACEDLNNLKRTEIANLLFTYLENIGNYLIGFMH